MESGVAIGIVDGMVVSGALVQLAHALVQFIKGGFGLAESPRLWFKKLQRTVKSMGAREWALIPGIFSFFHEGKVIAMTPA